MTRPMTRPATDLTVLVVDDAEDLRELLRIVVDQPGHGWRVVGTAADGDEAVAQARALRPDVVLLDLAMPVRDGLQALPLVKQAAPDARVVMLSGFPDHAARQAAMAAGADSYLEKSDIVATLVPHLRRLVDGGQPPPQPGPPGDRVPAAPAAGSLAGQRLGEPGIAQGMPAARPLT